MVDVPPDAYLMMDCDLNHQPEELPLFLAALREKSMVVGSRYCPGGRIEGMPYWKLCLSRVFNMIMPVALGLPVRDVTSGYRLIASADLYAIASEAKGKDFTFYIEFLLLLWKARFTVMEVPIAFIARTEGFSKLRIPKTSLEYIKAIPRLVFLKWGKPAKETRADSLSN